MYTVYILLCRDGSLYTGITTNMERRFALHQAGKASKYTRSRKVVKILYQEQRRKKSTALKREAEIKKMSRQEKLIVVGLYINRHPELGKRNNPYMLL